MFAMIDTQLSPWTVVLICLRTCALWLGPKARASAYDRSKVPLYKCPYPDSPDLGQHEKFLEGLNGTRIVLLGDSTTRCCLAEAFFSGTVCNWSDQIAYKMPKCAFEPLTSQYLQEKSYLSDVEKLCAPCDAHVPRGTVLVQVPIHDSGKLSRERSVPWYRKHS